MLFKKEFLQGLVYDKPAGVVISDEIIDHSRWTVSHEMLFSHEGKVYRTWYSVGATESQDEGPYEHDDDEIECDEVEPYEVITVQYRKVKP